MVDWDDLRIFAALVQLGDPLMAARRLKVNRTTVMRRIQNLEERLKAKLIEKRDGRYIASTDGKRLVEAALNIEMIFNRATVFVESTAGKVQGMVRVGAPDGLGSYYLTARLSQLQRRHPGLHIELGTRSVDFDLSRDEADIAVVLDRPETGNHYVRRLDGLTLRLYASADYLAQHRPVTSTADLGRLDFVGYPDHANFGVGHRAVLARCGVVPITTFSSWNIIAQLRAVEHGVGIGLFPAYIAREGHNLAPVLHDEVDVAVPLWLVIHHDLLQLARIKAVVREVDQGFREDRWLSSHEF